MPDCKRIDIVLQKHTLRGVSSITVHLKEEKKS